MIKAISYIRVSTVGQGQSGLGLMAQRSMIANYCKAHKITLIKEFREIKSGEDHEKRPEVQKAVNWCLLYPDFLLLVATQSRLGRSVFFIASLIKKKVHFISIEQPTANDFQKQIQAAFDEKFLEDNRNNTKRSLQARREKGFKFGGNVKKLKRTLKRKKRAYLKRIKRTIRREQKKYKTQRDLTNRLNRMRLKKLNGKRGGWHVSEVHNILHDLSKLK
ncbi:recombinase family protein [Niastella caeni]|uniref:Recombinase family protein n=1 Tax=Niastella caeni TaxID=2569763 RepID=A0A4S8I3W6_9BACT|nr:recombinase family protein [Niastella caeni]THU41874.1 recombinase family protein [Niastella caeni]